MTRIIGNRLVLIGAFMAFVFCAIACAEGEPEPAVINDNDNTRPDPNNQDTPDAGNGGDVINGEDDANSNNGGSGDSCMDNGDCEGDEVCARTVPNAEGSCVLPDDELVDGEECSDGAQCTSGLCYDGQCTTACSDESECLDGWDCDDLGDGGFCTPPACSTDDDCQGTQACAVTADGNAIQTVCLPDNGGGEAGDGCAGHDECVARYCIDSICSALCESTDHCGNFQSCDDGTITVDSASDDLRHCQPTSVEQCLSPGDCQDADMTCSLPTFGTDGGIDGASCGFTNPGEADLGESCVGSSSCESGLCLESDDGLTGECSVFCQDAGVDCGGDQNCMRVDEQLGLCFGECLRNEDCDGGNVCQIGLDTNDDIQTICDHTVGDKDTGEECDDSLDCTSGFCLTSYGTYDINCTGDAQCPGDSECTCPPNDPNCTQQTCVEQESRCSKLCDPANGDADCDTGGHEMTRCDDQIQVQRETEVEFVAACALEFE